MRRIRTLLALALAAAAPAALAQTPVVLKLATIVGVDNPFSTAAVKFKEIVEVLRVDVIQTKLRGPISTGHNMLAGLTYFLTFWVFLFQALTGFGLYAAMSHGIGSETQRPIAVVIVAGTVTACLLTLVLLPVFYLLLDRVQRRLRGDTTTTPSTSTASFSRG